MKKRVLTLLAAMMLTAAASAQVFVLNDEDNDRIANSGEGISIVNPGYHNSGEDWYTPVGSGAFLLTAMGGAYLLNKKKKKK